ncbi:MAG: hypothetical protein QF466_05095 [Desulfobacterales bacterium]|jgi:nitrogen fixation/metabolism regulation signal transduction histidine kinase|nr:hypothetical protein [Desulfobacterales bacterium]
MAFIMLLVTSVVLGLLVNKLILRRIKKFTDTTLHISEGNLADKNSQVYRLARAPNTFRALEDLGTEPKVVYLSEGEWHA